MVSKKAIPAEYRRSQAAVLARRLREPRRFINVVAGPRQVGKTTLVQQVMLDKHDQRGTLFVSADEPALRDTAWLSTHAFNERRALSIGGDGIPVEEFLARPVLDWL